MGNSSARNSLGLGLLGLGLTLGASLVVCAARRRAEVLAENSRARIGMLRSARQGVFQITPANSTEVSDYGRNDTSAREKSIKAVVTIRYALEG
jgi:hypothetical protein